MRSTSEHIERFERTARQTLSALRNACHPALSIRTRRCDSQKEKRVGLQHTGKKGQLLSHAGVERCSANVVSKYTDSRYFSLDLDKWRKDPVSRDKVLPNLDTVPDFFLFPPCSH